MGLRGLIDLQKFTFMLDSGASSNFISESLVRNLGLRYKSLTNHTVRLANGKLVQTVGQVQIPIMFGGFKYNGKFQVLSGDVPLILGMDFLVAVQPSVDWKNRKVVVFAGLRKFELPTCNIGSAELQNDNSFAGLKVDQDNMMEEAVQEAVAETCQKPRADIERCPIPNKRGKKCQKRCVQCGNVFVGNGSYCNNCNDEVIDKFVVHDQSDQHDHGQPQFSDIEVVNFKTFRASGMKREFEFVGLLQFDGNEMLNFTHRATLGGGDDADQNTGSYEQLAQQQLAKLKSKYGTVFSEPTYPVDRSECPQIFEHRIPLIDESQPPPKRKLYPLDDVELTELKKQLQDFLNSGRIEVANGPYGAPILFAKKKDGGLRMCIDYRALNAQTCNDVYPLPRPDELLQRLDGAKVFSKLDLRDGYHQIPMAANDKIKTSFTCRYGTFQFTVMPFGLSTAPATFQRMMNTIFFDLLDRGVLVYLDDVLIYSKTVEEHVELLDKVFSLLQLNKLYLKEKKCSLFLEKINFLGHVISSQGVSMESGKIDVVKSWPIPKTITHVQQFLGLCNYYRRFILRFSEVAAPLTLLTRKDQPFVWGKAQQDAFELLKNLLCNAPILKVFNYSLPTRVVCDASMFCVGGVLEQQEANGSWHPVEYYSKRLSISERNYSATDREYVAIRQCLERWRHFLIGIKFVILTDHVALTYIQSSATVSRRNARWLEFLSQFKFEIQHIKGRENVVADALSRIPGSEQIDCMQICSLTYTLGLQHIDDLGVECNKRLNKRDQLYGLVTIYENETFLKQLLEEQQQSTSEWFAKKVQLAENGSLQFQFRNGLLCKLIDDHFCPVVPSNTSSSVHVILSDLHNSALGGHLGFRKLLQVVQKRFFWQGMSKSVNKFVKNCPVCQSNKHSTQRPTGLLQPLENPTKPFQHVTMDFITHLPVSTRGHDAIFSIIDRFSRLCRFIPCSSSMSAFDCAQLFWEHWICRFGMPVKIVSDRDVKFTSAFWTELFKLMQCRVALSTAYHPQTDGLTERFHRSIEQVLRCYCSGMQSSWCSLLPQCEFALNSTFQDAIQDVPFQVVYGFLPQLPMDIQLDSVQLPAVHDFVTARRSIQLQVSTSLKEAQDRMARVANRARRDMSHQVGERVWLATKHLPLKAGTRKLAAIWAGPFEILEEIGPVAYRLQLPADWKVHNVFHVSQLKSVVGDIQFEQPVQVDQDEEFEIEAIVDSRVSKGKQQYLIKWKGYSDFENQWLDEDSLENAQDAIAQYQNHLSRKTSTRRGSGVRD